MASGKDDFLSFCFDLHKSSLIIIDDDLSRLSEYLALPIKLVGIDTETPPYAAKKITTLIQLAIRTEQDVECVFLIDLLKLSKMKPRLEELDLLLAPIFFNSKIIKLAQGLQQDFTELCVSYPQMTAFKSCNGVVETNALHQLLNPQISYNISLKNLTRNYLHFDLDKSCQMSNWGRRPLSEEQIEYAACDALVLLRLYDVMFCEAQQAQSNIQSKFTIDMILETFTVSTARSPRSAKTKRAVPNSVSSDSPTRFVAPSSSSPCENPTAICKKQITPNTSANRCPTPSECNDEASEGQDDTFEEENDDVSVYHQFYSFSERNWYHSEYSHNRRIRCNKSNIRLPINMNKRIKFNEDGSTMVTNMSLPVTSCEAADSTNIST